MFVCFPVQYRDVSAIDTRKYAVKDIHNGSCHSQVQTTAIVMVCTENTIANIVVLFSILLE